MKISELSVSPEQTGHLLFLPQLLRDTDLVLHVGSLAHSDSPVPRDGQGQTDASCGGSRVRQLGGGGGHTELLLDQIHLSLVLNPQPLQLPLLLQQHQLPLLPLLLGPELHLRLQPSLHLGLDHLVELLVEDIGVIQASLQQI